MQIAKARLTSNMKTSFFKRIASASLVAALLSLSSVAHAISLTPTPGTFVLAGNETSEGVIQNKITVYFNSLGLSLDQLYKATQAAGTPDVGDFAGSYSTAFSNGATDQFAHAYITHDDGTPAINSSSVYAFIRDGNYVNYNWYLFDITGWDGLEAINFDGFFSTSSTTSKNISHVAIYGNRSTSVPDSGTTAVLLGLGLVGMSFVSRRKTA